MGTLKIRISSKGLRIANIENINFNKKIASHNDSRLTQESAAEQQ